MTDETRQAIRDCAAMALLEGMRAALKGTSGGEVGRNINGSITRKFPDAFTEHQAIQSENLAPSGSCANDSSGNRLDKAWREEE